MSLRQSSKPHHKEQSTIHIPRAIRNYDTLHELLIFALQNQFPNKSSLYGQIVLLFWDRWSTKSTQLKDYWEGTMDFGWLSNLSIICMVVLIAEIRSPILIKGSCVNQDIIILYHDIWYSVIGHCYYKRGMPAQYDLSSARPIFIPLESIQGIAHKLS